MLRRQSAVNPLPLRVTMLPILTTVLAAVVSGSTVGGALGAVTIGQWLTLAEGAAEAIAPSLASHLGLKVSGNSLGSIIDGIVKAATDELTKQGVKDWLAANGEGAIRLRPGMGTDY